MKQKNNLYFGIGICFVIALLAKFLPDVVLAVGIVLFLISIVFLVMNLLKPRKGWQTNLVKLLLSAVILFFFGSFFSKADEPQTIVTQESTQISSTEVASTTKDTAAIKEKERQLAEEKAAKEKIEQITTQREKTYHDLANMEYQGSQTIQVAEGIPDFLEEEISLKEGPWEKYGELDSLGRATAANALLSQKEPSTKEQATEGIEPSGWQNVPIKSGELYKRTALIEASFANEQVNEQNILTGTQQLSDKQLRDYESKITSYLEKSTENYVRYRVTPVFKDEELVARGLHLEAQSINSKEICFNVYIFNIQDGATINYADGTSELSAEIALTSPDIVVEEVAEETPAPIAEEAPVTEQEQAFVDASGNGLIKGSKNGIYHIPGSRYYNRTTNPVAWFKTVSEAEAAGYRAPLQ